MKDLEKSIILFESGDYWVSNEGTRYSPSYHVWRCGITHSTADSAYAQLDLAIFRCKYLAKKNEKISN